MRIAFACAFECTILPVLPECNSPARYSRIISEAGISFATGVTHYRTGPIFRTDSFYPGIFLMLKSVALLIGSPQVLHVSPLFCVCKHLPQAVHRP